jgi:hypothetical protein
MSSEQEITLFHWNIVELSDDLAIFVGLRNRTQRQGLSYPYNCSCRFSTAIKCFDKESGQGTTLSGRIYYCLGTASDPDGLIRRAVHEEMRGRPYRFRYQFSMLDA